MWDNNKEFLHRRNYKLFRPIHGRLLFASEIMRNLKRTKMRLTEAGLSRLTVVYVLLGIHVASL